MPEKDLFSNHAQAYAAFRPTYPKELYNFINQHVRKFDTAWDAGTGNGQVARDLSLSFNKVLATDISERQLANAYSAPNIFYSVAAEQTDFENHSIDLITVAQAIHWFDRSRFYKEVDRVATKEAVLAVWGYALLSIAPDIDKVVQHFYTKVVGPYWDAERRLIDERYATIAFPFEEIATPAFQFSFDWTLDEFQGYISTWSAVQKFIKANQVNPVDEFIRQIRPLWKEEKQTINFPLFLRLGEVG